MITKVRTRVTELYDAWAFAAVESALALEAWTSALNPEKGNAYSTYVASLDREERAAKVLAEGLACAGVRRLRTAGQPC
jgi:hypothetical protein